MDPSSLSTGDLLEAVNKVLKREEEEELVDFVRALEELRKRGGSALTDAAQSCGDACRDAGWRERFGESGALDCFMNVLEDGIDPTLARNVLRVAGNCVADHDANRKRFVEHPGALGVVLSMVHSDDDGGLNHLAAAVIHNLVLGNDIAPHKVIEQGAFPAFIHAISSGDHEDIQLPLRVIEVLIADDFGKENCPTAALEPLLQKVKAGLLSTDDHQLVINIVSTLLTQPIHQLAVIEHDLFFQFMDIIGDNHALLSHPDLTTEDKQSLFHANSTLINIAGDISWREEFLLKYPIDCPTMLRAIQRLDSPHADRSHETIRVCLVLGNVARTREVCKRLVCEFAVHKSLFRIVSGAVLRYQESKKEEGGQVREAGAGSTLLSIVHCALGVVRNFAVAEELQDVLGRDGAFDIACEVLALDGLGVEDARHSACIVCRMLCAKSAQNSTLATTSMHDGEPPYLSRILEIYPNLEQDLPTKTEIGRTVVGVLRSLARTTTTTTTIHHRGVARPLWDMLLQTKWPAIRTEGSFGLALLARSGDGGVAEVVREWGDAEMECLKELDGCDVENVAGMVVKVRENACGESIRESRLVEEFMRTALKEAGT